MEAEIHQLGDDGEEVEYDDDDEVGQQRKVNSEAKPEKEEAIDPSFFSEEN